MRPVFNKINKEKNQHKNLGKIYFIKVSIPKLKVESTHMDLGQVLKSMGIHDAFDEQKADFSSMSNDYKGLNIGKISQKSMIEASLLIITI